MLKKIIGVVFGTLFFVYGLVMGYYDYGPSYFTSCPVDEESTQIMETEIQVEIMDIIIHKTQSHDWRISDYSHQGNMSLNWICTITGQDIMMRR